MLNTDVLEDADLEIKAKYFYIFLFMLFQNNKETIKIYGTAEEMSKNMGLTLAMFYGARKICIKRGIIKLSKLFCQETGKKISDVYELI